MSWQPIELDYHSREPLCKQATLQIKKQICSGLLLPGEKLPPVRQLSAELQINPSTAMRVYSQLAKEGIVIQKAGIGVFVAEMTSPFSDEYIDTQLSHLALAFLIEGLRHGLNYKQIQNILKTKYDEMARNTR
ncbi:MAG: GntR family transcriptional regulator [Thermoguttaceae bacterium]